jgi:hypothetical protein
MMTDEELRQQIMTKLTVPIWPHTCKALGVGRDVGYQAANRGEIPTVSVGRRKPVPTTWLRRKLGLEGGEAA